VGKARRSLSTPCWAYAYAIVPAQPKVHLNAIRALLEKEHSEALRAACTWTGKLVCGHKVTHILVVSDSPDQRRAVNRRLESRLRRLKTSFSVTLPMSLRRP
jgi:hypothetical protein